MKKLIALITLLAGITIQAAQISYTTVVPLTSTDWTNMIQIHQFSPALGQLYKVAFSAEYTNHRYAGFYSFAATNVNYNIAYKFDVHFLWPDGTQMLGEEHNESASGPLGISGGTYIADLANDGFLNAESCKDFPPAKVAPWSWLGTGYIPFTAVETGVIMANMDLSQIFAFFLTQGGFNVTVTYFYTPGLSGTAFPCH